jgi:hypothetical protein
MENPDYFSPLETWKVLGKMITMQVGVTIVMERAIQM